MASQKCVSSSSFYLDIFNCNGTQMPIKRFILLELSAKVDAFSIALFTWVSVDSVIHSGYFLYVML